MEPEPGFAVLLWVKKCQMFQAEVEVLVYLQTFFYDYRLIVFKKSVLFALLSKNFLDQMIYMTKTCQILR